jgi:hypothetical protein
MSNDPNNLAPLWIMDGGVSCAMLQLDLNKARRKFVDDATFRSI